MKIKINNRYFEPNQLKEPNFEGIKKNCIACDNPITKKDCKIILSQTEIRFFCNDKCKDGWLKENGKTATRSCEKIE
jgi:hypothetical protein